MLFCACGSKHTYQHCCEPYLTYQKTPDTPEALMRSRYTAYTKGDIGYIEQTMQGRAAIGFSAADSLLWARRVIWLDLHILRVNEDGNTGQVEFIARFIDDGRVHKMHEVSDFVYEGGQWFYVDGKQTQHAPQKIARNTTCPCGSGKKFKQCHAKQGILK